MRNASVVVTLLLMCCAVCGGQSYMASNALPAAKETSTLPASTLQPQPTTVYSMIEVNSKQAADALKEVAPLHASHADILSSAGTYGDFSRYLQMFPGVVFNNDESDDLIVRGGNPIENLYLVDGIEVPNINHLSTESTTGGLVSMIDTGSIRDVDLRTGGYDSSYPERLSSVISINTKQLEGVRRREQAELGTVGAGGLVESPLPNQGYFLISAHRSLLNLANDIGLNGVPIFTNALEKAEWNASPDDKITFLSLSGDDSISIRPCAKDLRETNTINTQYSGWRTTNGVRWQHLYSPNSFGTMTLSDSEQHQNIQQQDQYLGTQAIKEQWSTCDQAATAFTPVTVYQEATNDGQTNLHYDYLAQFKSRISLKTGGVASLRRFNYNVMQPVGAQSPLSIDPARSDSTSFFSALFFWRNGLLC